MLIAKIVSGGQTGVDRGAIAAARELGFPYGGLIPKGGRVLDWLKALGQEGIGVNVAGPRESKSPGIQAKTHAFVSRLIQSIRGTSAAVKGERE